MVTPLTPMLQFPNNQGDSEGISSVSEGNVTLCCVGKGGLGEEQPVQIKVVIWTWCGIQRYNLNKLSFCAVGHEMQRQEVQGRF